jgi:hypothetical protein
MDMFRRGRRVQEENAGRLEERRIPNTLRKAEYPLGRKH